MTLTREIRDIMGRISKMESQVSKLPSRISSSVGGSGGGGSGDPYSIGTVPELPDIPVDGMLEVFWTSAGAGNGDDQIWRTYAGQTKWTPTQKFTSKSGVPL